MMKWLCTLILLLFAVTAGTASPAPPDGPVRLAATAETLVAAASSFAIIPAPRDCCADEFKAKPAATPCLVDFSMLPAAFALSTPENRQDHARGHVRISIALLSEPLHRPPIA